MAANFDKLWKKARSATDEAESVRTLAEILSSKDGRKFISDLEPADALLCIGVLDHGLTEHKLHRSEKQVFFVTLRRLAGKHARLPESMVITDKIEFSISGQSNALNRYADIKRGRYKGHAVAVKVLRVAMTDNFDEIRRQFCKDVILWNSLSHPNVLKLVGVLAGTERYQFATVSEWMAHGNITEYIRKNAVNRLELLHGAAQGLKYLHDASLAHGVLKGSNIFMTNDTPPKACLADFGFAAKVLDPRTPMAPSFTPEGSTIAFMAPELLAPSKYGLRNAVPTQEGDIYAFGLVILQVLTGQQPFRSINPLELTYRVLHGVRPDRPANAEAIGISDSLWKLIWKCWDGERTRRPRIQGVVVGLRNAAASWHADMPPNANLFGNNGFGVFENASLMTLSSSHGSDSTTFFTTPSTPYENLEPGEISETKENDPTNDDNTAKENRPVAPTDRTPGRLPHEPEAHTTTKRKSVWNRVMQIITGSVAL